MGVDHSQIYLNYLREPIPEIAQAASILDEAVSHHLAGRADNAQSLIKQANLSIIREWTESLWGTNSPYVKIRPDASIVKLPKEARIKVRMPNSVEKRNIHARDGYNCRFCGIPVIRAEVRQRIAKIYPIWGRKNYEQHAAFQAMWAQYDHVLPHSKGGDNDLENVILTCAPCNFARMDYTLEEVGLNDPRAREPVKSSWSGLERFK